MFLFYVLFVLFYIPLSLIYPTRVIGRKNLKGTRKSGIIFACNHQSMIDVPMLGIKLRRYQRYVAKKEFEKNFFMRLTIKGTKSFFVDRSKPNLQFYKDATQAINNGSALTIFPEGTRNKDVSSEDMLELKNGLAMFAIKTKCPVVPMFFAKRPHPFRRNTLFIGQLFKLDMFDKVTKENLAAATEIVSQKFAELKEQATGRLLDKQQR